MLYLAFSRSCIMLVLMATASTWALSAETLRIGAEDDWYPYTAYRHGEIQGMSVDIVKAAFAASGTAIELVPYPYARCMQLTHEGQLAACFNTSPDRRIDSEFLLPEESLFSDDILLWANREGAQPDEHLQRLANRRVAVTIGYEYGPVFDNNRQVLRIPVRRDLSGFLMLQRGRVDFVAAYRGTAQALFQENPQLAGQFVPVAVLHRPQLYLSLSRRHPHARELLERFDSGMRTIRGNGHYRQILEHWHHDTEPAD
ncbi:substrate-binding periplasmic protein [Phytopseudomonas dryadis]|uniref:ABC transporter permease n=1 Tax=Phytopseudomonas dryadis TaxID=2487520 RepID=A0A4Q9RA37_9GAMM|nr:MULTISPECIES: transporter substrate-binding domain-containing protein [Pseudomonas]TBU97004.1 ABC transporter permease [Pseudomonas dryadis]TBV08658.1 ABC transporter permease [Pseudomonas dryadis]TBV13906.1 ABC transporter permease [Pseudomonas sp. FRB 230]